MVFLFHLAYTGLGFVRGADHADMAEKARALLGKLGLARPRGDIILAPLILPVLFGLCIAGDEALYLAEDIRRHDDLGLDALVGILHSYDRRLAV